MNEYVDLLELPDKRTVKFSRLAIPGELGKLKTFIGSMPEEDLLSINIDKNDRQTLELFMDNLKDAKHSCICARFEDGSLAGFTMLKLPEYGWMRSIAEIKGVVHPELRKLGIAKKLLYAIFRISISENKSISTLIIRSIEGDRSSADALEYMGFKKHCVIEGFAHDIVGRRKNLVIYALDVNEFWNKIAYGKQFGRSMED